MDALGGQLELARIEMDALAAAGERAAPTNPLRAPCNLGIMRSAAAPGLTARWRLAACAWLALVTRSLSAVCTWPANAPARARG